MIRSRAWRRMFDFVCFCKFGQVICRSCSICWLIFSKRHFSRWVALIRFSDFWPTSCFTGCGGMEKESLLVSEKLGGLDIVFLFQKRVFLLIFVLPYPAMIPVDGSKLELILWRACVWYQLFEFSHPLWLSFKLCIKLERFLVVSIREKSTSVCVYFVMQLVKGDKA